MKLGERRPEQPILNAGKDLVADELIERHPAAPRRAAVEHSGSENRVGLAIDQRLEKIVQAFRRILPVSMNESDDVELLPDRVMKSDLLVPAISLVDRIEQDRSRERSVGIFARAFERPVGGG